MMMDTEAAVMVNLDFLTGGDVDIEDDDDGSMMTEYPDMEPGDDLDDEVKSVKRKGKQHVIHLTPGY